MRNNLAHTLSAQGDLAGARDQWTKALAGALCTWGEDHPNTQAIRKFLADLG